MRARGRGQGKAGVEGGSVGGMDEGGRIGLDEMEEGDNDADGGCISGDGQGGVGAMEGDGGGGGGGGGGGDSGEGGDGGGAVQEYDIVP